MGSFRSPVGASGRRSSGDVGAPGGGRCKYQKAERFRVHFAPLKPGLRGIDDHAAQLREGELDPRLGRPLDAGEPGHRGAARRGGHGWRGLPGHARSRARRRRSGAPRADLRAAGRRRPRARLGPSEHAGAPSRRADGRAAEHDRHAGRGRAAAARARPRSQSMAPLWPRRRRWQGRWATPRPRRPEAPPAADVDPQPAIDVGFNSPNAETCARCAAVIVSHWTTREGRWSVLPERSARLLAPS